MSCDCAVKHCTKFRCWWSLAVGCPNTYIAWSCRTCWFKIEKWNFLIVFFFLYNNIIHSARVTGADATESFQCIRANMIFSLCVCRTRKLPMSKFICVFWCYCCCFSFSNIIALRCSIFFVFGCFSTTLMHFNTIHCYSWR